MQSDTLAIEKKACLLSDIVNDAVRAVKPLSATRGVTIAQSLKEFKTLGDHDRLVQVLVNILANAIDSHQKEAPLRYQRIVPVPLFGSAFKIKVQVSLRNSKILCLDPSSKVRNVLTHNVKERGLVCQSLASWWKHMVAQLVSPAPLVRAVLSGLKYLKAPSATNL